MKKLLEKASPCAGLCLLTLILLACSVQACGQEPAGKSRYVLTENISYVSAGEQDAYRRERCKLDVYYPADEAGFPTVVWFHGGALETGGKHLPAELREKGIALVAVNYRLSPRATCPAYLTDAAEALAWVFGNIQSLGGNPGQVFIAGHSAGAYLALMLALDKSYLAAHGADADRIKGIIPVSGQTNTHYTIRKERGLDPLIPLVDGYAPLNRVRRLPFPVLLITGDRRLELTARYEENAQLDAVLRSLGNEQVEFFELQGFDHGTVLSPACRLIVSFVKRESKIKPLIF